MTVLGRSGSAAGRPRSGGGAGDHLHGRAGGRRVSGRNDSYRPGVGGLPSELQRAGGVRLCHAGRPVKQLRRHSVEVPAARAGVRVDGARCRGAGMGRRRGLALGLRTAGTEVHDVVGISGGTPADRDSLTPSSEHLASYEPRERCLSVFGLAYPTALRTPWRPASHGRGGLTYATHPVSSRASQQVACCDGITRCLAPLPAPRVVAPSWWSP